MAQRIGQIKRQTGNQVVDSTRESEVLRRLEGLNKGPLNPNVLRHIFVDIIEEIAKDIVEHKEIDTLW